MTTAARIRLTLNKPWRVFWLSSWWHQTVWFVRLCVFCTVTDNGCPKGHSVRHFVWHTVPLAVTACSALLGGTPAGRVHQCCQPGYIVTVTDSFHTFSSGLVHWVCCATVTVAFNDSAPAVRQCHDVCYIEHTVKSVAISMILRCLPLRHVLILECVQC